MAKKRGKKTELKLTKEQERENAKAGFRAVGLIVGIFAKALLKMGDCEVDFKINGEEISAIEKLQGLDITERIQLAVKEERYEDAANLKKILDRKTPNKP